MKIKRMTATFGALDGAVLEPDRGLTVISAPNEGGKSTWAGFLKAMLYGIDTRERDKTGFLADKNRYQPWSGAPMAGELQVEWQGKDVTIRRFASRSNPFGGFEAVYTATGDPVPGLTAANVGEQLTGAGREVFLRSAFVGQGGAAIAPSGELEARVAALATSGEEDVSYSAAERTLKDWRNRRRANRANGLIPQIEEERAELLRSRQDREQAQCCREEAEAGRAALEAERDGLQGELDVWRRIERHELNRRYAGAYLEWEQAKAAVPEDKPHPVFGTMTGEEAWAFAQEKQRERNGAEEENRRREARRAEAEKHRVRGKLELLVGGCFGAAMLMMFAIQLMDGSPLTALSGAAVLACVFCLFHGWKLIRRAQDERMACRLVPVPEEEDWMGQAAGYRETLAAAQQARVAEAAARRRMDDLAAQGGQLADTLEFLHTPAQSKTAIAARLGAVERELERVRGELARAEGALAHMGDGGALESRLSELEGHLAQRQEEYDAIDLALSALSAANDALRQRFSPSLNQEAGAVLAALTGGQYPVLSLARDFSAQATRRDGLLPRSTLALSTGTVEQLYLAVRLAICRLTLPDAPLVLDDALAAFDDGRMALALDYLKTLAQERQILLFTCQRREADWAAAHGCTMVIKSDSCCLVKSWSSK